MRNCNPVNAREPSLIINQHGFRYWFDAVKQQTITWANNNLDVCCLKLHWVAMISFQELLKFSLQRHAAILTQGGFIRKHIWIVERYSVCICWTSHHDCLTEWINIISQPLALFLMQRWDISSDTSTVRCRYDWSSFYRILSKYNPKLAR